MTPADHLGDRIAALVDGQLGHADRDRVFAHLSRCASCRAEAAEQRALKARLDHLAAPASTGLEGRLMALAAPQAPPATLSLTPPPAPPAPPVARAARRPAPLPTTAGLLLVGAGLGGLALLGGQADEPLLDPGARVLVVEHVTTTTQVPLSDPVVVGAAWGAVTPTGGR